MANIDYDAARELLSSALAIAEANLFQGSAPVVPPHVVSACQIIFESSTQAFREVLLGCAIARIQDQTINIRQPYVKQGRNAFNGRTLDEKVVNPFLHDKRIPSSKGPYLSAFRRSVQFDAETRKGVREKKSYDAFLTLIAYLERSSRGAALQSFLAHLLYSFAKLREAADVPLAKLQRISLDQYNALISGLLASASGGRYPVLLIVSAFKTIKEFFSLEWEISYQGINVADAAAGAGGDITITSGGRVLMAAEVTERPVDRSRVVSTFNTKIAPSGIEDYLFFTKLSGLASDARHQANQYFSQGHEVNFVEIKDWILMALATMGRTGRSVFNSALLELLDEPDTPRSLKVTWNEQIAKLTSV